MFITLFLIGFSVIAQSIDYNTKKGYVAKGYDVVAYFSNKAVSGDSKYSTTHDGVKYKFSTKENLDTFKANPDKFVPKYGGYCAYAVAVYGKKVNINPDTYEIRNGELYLFYNSGSNNTLELWKKESPEELKTKADKTWDKIKKK